MEEVETTEAKPNMKSKIPFLADLIKLEKQSITKPNMKSQIPFLADLIKLEKQSIKSEDGLSKEGCSSWACKEEILQEEQKGLGQPRASMEEVHIKDEPCAAIWDCHVDSKEMKSLCDIQHFQPLAQDTFSETLSEQARNIEQVKEEIEDSEIVDGNIENTAENNYKWDVEGCENDYKCDGEGCEIDYTYNGEGCTDSSNLFTLEMGGEKQKSYKCDVCGKEYRSSRRLIVHERKHTGKKTYKCDLCGKGFIYSGHLKIHLRTHIEDKPYKCYLCGNHCNTITRLKVHIRRHTGEKPYKCDLCGNSCNTITKLKEHLRAHTGESLHQCDVCGKGFSQVRELTSHKRTHSGEKPYNCDMSALNFLQLSTLLQDKRSSIAFLQEHRILHSSRRCFNNHAMKLSVTDKHDRWICRHSTCRLDIAIRRDTFLDVSRLSYRQVILFIYCWSQELTSISFCQSELGINHKTTVTWSNFLREVCANTLLSHPLVIGGPNTIVEVDESLFSRRKNHAGRIIPQQWVFGGICSDTNECFMVCVPDRTAATLLPIITTHIRPGTTVVSDLWRAYGGISNIPGFSDLTVNHSMNFVDPDTGAHTQRIERLWRSAKKRNKRQCGTHRHMIDSYMCEFMWRRRTRCAGLNAFTAILADIALMWPAV